MPGTDLVTYPIAGRPSMHNLEEAIRYYEQAAALEAIQGLDWALDPILCRSVHQPEMLQMTRKWVAIYRRWARESREYVHVVAS